MSEDIFEEEEQIAQEQASVEARVLRHIIDYLVEMFPQDVFNLPPSPRHGIAPHPEGA